MKMKSIEKSFYEWQHKDNIESTYKRIMYFQSLDTIFFMKTCRFGSKSVSPFLLPYHVIWQLT